MAQQKTALIVGMAKSGIAAARLLYETAIGSSSTT